MLNLPFISQVEEYKAAKCQQHRTLSLSSDKNIHNQEIKINTGRNWKVEVAIDTEIAAMRKLELMGVSYLKIYVTKTKAS